MCLSSLISGGSRFLTKGNGITKVADIVKIVFSRDPEDFVYASKHQLNLAKAYKVGSQTFQ